MMDRHGGAAVGMWLLEDGFPLALSCFCHIADANMQGSRIPT
jgi:hypothetical protein